MNGHMTLVSWNEPLLVKRFDELAVSFGLQPRHLSHKAIWFQGATSVKTARMVVVWNGQHYGTMQAVAMCRRRGIPYACVEYGMLPQSSTWFLDRSGFNGESSLNGSLEHVTDAQIQDLHERRWQLQEKYPLEPEGHVLVPCQVPNDTQILYHSHYQRMSEVVRDVAAMYPSQKVVIRPHPTCKQGISFPQNKMHVLDREPADFLDAARKASVVVGVNSTCLLEAAVLGVPIVALGDCPLRTHSARHRDRLLAAMLARTQRRDEPMRPRFDIMGVRPC